MKISGGWRRTVRSAFAWGLCLGVSTFGCVGGSVAVGQSDGTGRSSAANGVGTPFELSFWESVANSNDRGQLEAYLAQYPNGTFSRLAQAKIAALAPVAAATVQPALAPSPSIPVAIAAPAAIAPPPPSPIFPSVPVAPVAAPAAGTVAAQPASLLDQLTAIGKGGAPTAPELFSVAGPVPQRPVLAPMVTVVIPDHFCSAVERNRFHDTVYVPAIAAADRNNQATITHLETVQSLHAQALAANNIAGANALAHEATAFKPVADQTYAARIAMTDYFARIMAVPITGC